jgi:hypothetical protein
MSSFRLLPQIFFSFFFLSFYIVLLWGNPLHPIKYTPYFAESFANFTVSCNVEKGNHHPVFSYHYSNCEFDPSVRRFLIRICQHPFDTVTFEPHQKITTGYARNLLLQGIPNDRYLEVIHPLTVKDFYVTYTPIGTPSDPHGQFTLDYCLPQQSWIVIISTSTQPIRSKIPIIGPIC